MSPPLTLGLTGRLVAWTHRAPLVFNIQDVFPDAAVETGAITNRGVIAVASWLERASYRAADAVTVLSDDLRANVTGKLPPRGRRHGPHDPQLRGHRAHRARRPDDRLSPRARDRRRAGRAVRRQHRVLTVRRAAARRRPPTLPNVTFLVNGEGVGRDALIRAADGLANVRFAGYVPEDRLPELLATGDIHAVPLKRGLAAVSVPSKTYSILAAGRPVVAAIDPGTEIPARAEIGSANTQSAYFATSSFYGKQPNVTAPGDCAHRQGAGRTQSANAEQELTAAHAEDGGGPREGQKSVTEGDSHDVGRHGSRTLPGGLRRQWSGLSAEALPAVESRAPVGVE